MRRMTFILVAFFVGWLIAVIGAIRSADEPLGFIFAPGIAVIASLIVLIMVLVIGLLLKIPALSQYWSHIPKAVLGLIVSACVTVILVVYYLGFLRSVAADISFFVLMFVIANWPLNPRTLK